VGDQKDLEAEYSHLHYENEQPVVDYWDSWVINEAEWPAIKGSIELSEKLLGGGSIVLIKEFRGFLCRKARRAGGSSLLFIFAVVAISAKNCADLKSKIEEKSRRAVTIYVQRVELRGDVYTYVYARMQERNSNLFVCPADFAIVIAGKTHTPRLFAFKGELPPAAVKYTDTSPIPAVVDDETSLSLPVSLL